ncbi:hypothetical protein QBC45DRAFT_411429 [Copromyces sp. CBS 386.78]|nr:hypothetical protein QBC45DRAFT_411429 [Copromyces sp. CBS 386.78]
MSSFRFLCIYSAIRYIVQATLTTCKSDYAQNRQASPHKPHNRGRSDKRYQIHHLRPIRSNTFRFHLPRYMLQDLITNKR